jgi:hypothetical protein
MASFQFEHILYDESREQHIKMLVGKTRYLSCFTNRSRDLPPPVQLPSAQPDTKFRAIWNKEQKR